VAPDVVGSIPISHPIIHPVSNHLAEVQDQPGSVQATQFNTSRTTLELASRKCAGTACV
jgi:hypothetical protein